MTLQVLHADDARNELQHKTLLEIERETAKTWGARAAAAFELASSSSGVQRAKWLSDAENYRQESLEHAAMTGDIKFIEQVLDDLESVRRAVT